MKCMTTVRNLYISTHALTEGDQSDDERVQFQYNFNSRPHGGRLSKLPSGNTALYFNSRPHGGRPLMRSFLCHWHYFNSRPHGGRLFCLLSVTPFKNFNSRPHGGRPDPCIQRSASGYFNSRPHGGRLRFSFSAICE